MMVIIARIKVIVEKMVPFLVMVEVMMVIVVMMIMTMMTII